MTSNYQDPTILCQNYALNLIFLHPLDPVRNEYLIVEPDTMLLRSVSHDEFQSNQLKYLTWFTACNSVDTVFEECSNCDLCVGK